MNIFKTLFSILLLSLLINPSYSQNSFNDDLSGLMQEAHKAMQEMERRHQELQQQALSGKAPSNRQSSFSYSSSGGSGQWQDSGEEMTLVVPLQINRGLKTDVSIANGIITITNSSEANSSYSYSATNQISIPRNLNADKPKYKTEGNKLYISFMKI